MNTRLPAVVLSTLLLAACGNKGPLLPPPPPEEAEDIDKAAEVPSAAARDAGAEADPVPPDDIDPPLPTEQAVPPPIEGSDEPVDEGEASDDAGDPPAGDDGDG